MSGQTLVADAIQTLNKLDQHKPQFLLDKDLDEISITNYQEG